MYKICVNRLHVVLRLLVNSKLLIVKFVGSQKLYAGFQLCRERGSVPLTLISFKGWLYSVRTVHEHVYILNLNTWIVIYKSPLVSFVTHHCFWSIHVALGKHGSLLLHAPFSRLCISFSLLIQSPSDRHKKFPQEMPQWTSYHVFLQRHWQENLSVRL